MIWYVEDDASSRDIAIYALNSAGFETKGFEDGMTFWEALKKEKPELIVLDVMLPGMDGIEILSKMKDSMEYSRVPVIMATAKGQEYDLPEGFLKAVFNAIHEASVEIQNQIISEDRSE